MYLTKKQKSEIARKYAGSVILNYLGDDMGETLVSMGVSEEDVEEIIEKYYSFGKQILSGRELYYDVKNIVQSEVKG